jgi:imidazolonepropionase-like amidohydrolase
MTSKANNALLLQGGQVFDAPNLRFTVDMPTTISKFVALGMPLEQAIAASGYSAAVKLGMDKVFGVIREGNQADIGIFELQTAPMNTTTATGTPSTPRSGWRRCRPSTPERLWKPRSGPSECTTS